MWKQSSPDKEVPGPHDCALAVAALMVEIMRLDGHLHPLERQAVEQALALRFDLSPSELSRLIDDALAQTATAIDLHQFTRKIVRHFSTAERIRILGDVWRVAHADGHVDPYEEQLIRRMADLMGLHHSQFITAKIEASRYNQTAC